MLVFVTLANLSLKFVHIPLELGLPNTQEIADCDESCCEQCHELEIVVGFRNSGDDNHQSRISRTRNGGRERN